MCPKVGSASGVCSAILAASNSKYVVREFDRRLDNNGLVKIASLNAEPCNMSSESLVILS